MTNWTTFYGVTFDLENLTHQHLSNLSWFSKIMNEILVGQSLLNIEMVNTDEIDKFIKNKYGEILEYRPHHDYKYEITTLHDYGYFEWIIPQQVANISLKGKQIGQSFSKEYLRNMNIEKIVTDDV